MKHGGIMGVIGIAATYGGVALGQPAPVPAERPAQPPADQAPPPPAERPAQPPADQAPPPPAEGALGEPPTAAPAVPPRGEAPTDPAATGAADATMAVPEAASPTAPPSEIYPAAPAPLAPPLPPPPVEPALKVYGFARLDVAYATGRMQNLQFGLWALPPDAEGDYTPEFTMYPRWSRLGVEWNGGGIGGDLAKISAKLEVDFNDTLRLDSGRSESRALLRMYQAYGQVEIGDLAILGGQAWDLFAPLNTGGMEQVGFWYGGNLGDRRPQLRVTYAPSFGPVTLVVAAAAAQSGAIDNADLDGDGVMDGNAWARPAGQGLAELKIKALRDQAIRVGVSGHFGGETIEVAGTPEDFEVMAVVGHLEVPISVVTLRAELWTGENTNDLRGGVGQGIRTEREELEDGTTVLVAGRAVPARGGWLHLNVTPVPWYSVTLGVSRDDPYRVPEGGRDVNEAFDFTNVFTPWKPVKVGLVYDLYRTRYHAAPDARVHRFCGYTMVSF